MSTELHERHKLRQHFSEHIQSLSRSNPIIYAGICSYVNGVATMEQALTFMVEAMAVDVAQLTELLRKAMELNLPPIIISMEKPA